MDREELWETAAGGGNGGHTRTQTASVKGERKETSQRFMFEGEVWCFGLSSETVSGAEDGGADVDGGCAGESN